MTSLLLMAAAVLAVGGDGTDGAANPVGRQIAPFALEDFRGKQHALADFAASKVLVVAFLGTECPVATSYGPRLEALQTEFGPRGVAFIGIDSNSQDSLAELAAFARSHGLTFPLLKDAGNTVADQIGALRTPEVFALDAQRVVRYWGRIDDQFRVGIRKKSVERRDLAEALEEMLADKPVTQPALASTGCLIGRVPKIEPHGDVTYSNQIARILENRCVSCHRSGEVAPFALTTYDEVVGWGEMIREVTQQGSMPPWFASPEFGSFKNHAALSVEEKQLIEQWVANGSPQGDPASLPERRTFTDGWQIGTPDQVLYIDDEPVTVPAEGEVKYQYFPVDPGFTEDKWIVAAEARPGNRSVVHHILVYVIPPGATGEFRGRAVAVGYAPGMPPSTFPEGVAMFAPKGSKLIFQMHYTPNGVEQTDRSYVGLKFADPATVEKRASGGMILNLAIQVPAGADDYEVQAEKRFKNDLLLLSLTPHMHLRGKAFRFEAEYPDGQKEVLLDVPRYDFNWQLRYELAEAKLMPKGTVLRCTARYDNSAANLANPDPTVAVGWGDQTWEEMMIGWYSAIPTVPDAHPAAAEPAPKTKE